MSWIEVESKIKIKNPKEARKKIKKIAKFVKFERKIDDYYSLENNTYPKKSIRIRNKGKKVEVNFKKWLSYLKGVHAKSETEFEVSDLRGFFGLLNDFGFRKWMRKEKITELYKTRDNVNIELNYVKRLGWYIEIEVLCKKNEIANARKKVIEVRRKLGLHKNIEKRGYTRQLWRLGK